MIAALTRAALGLSLVLLIAGCASPVTYFAPATEPGGYGLSEKQLDQRTWEIGFSGNRFTTREQVENSVLYRAAEIAKAAGADGFIVLKEEVDREQRFPGPYYGPYGYPYYGFTTFGFYGAPEYSSRYGYLLRPIRPYYGRPGTEYTISARVRLYSGIPPPDLGTPYNAQEVLTRLAPTIPPRPPASG